MSEMNTDPYQPQEYSPASVPAKASGRMEYMRSVNYIFENPNWLMNVFCMALCNLIPLVGPLIIYGYQFEIVESLHLRRHQTYPDFDFNRFVDYLVRGLWVFLVCILLSLLIVPVMLLVIGLPLMLMIGGGAAAGEEGAAAGMMIGMPIMMLLAFFFIIILNIFCVPFILRAGLTQDFGASFDFGFAKQFVANTWLEMILAGLFFMVMGMVFAMLGMVICFVGIYMTMAATMMAQAHLGYQLYEVHLAKGGTPIPITPSKPTAPAKPVQ